MEEGLDQRGEGRRRSGTRSFARDDGFVGAEAWAEGVTLAHEGSNTMWHAIVVAAPALETAWIAMANASGPGAEAVRAWVRAMLPAA